MDYSDTCRSVYRSRNQWLHASRWLRAARILTAISSCSASPTRFRPAHNRDCPRIGADGLSLGQSRGPPHVAKRRWHRPQRDDMTGSHDWLPGVASPKVSGLGASAHILSGTPKAVGFPEASDMRQTVAVADAAHALAEKQLTCSPKPP